MLLRELLFETISASKYFPEIQKDLLNIFVKNKDYIQYIKSKIKETSGIDINVTVKTPLKGDGSYVHEENTLYINKRVIDTIIKNINEYNSTKPGKETKKHNLTDSVNRLSSIIVHELTHIIQLSKSGKPYEKSMVYNKPGVDKVVTTLGLKSKKQRSGYKGDKEDLKLKKLNVYIARLSDPSSEINIAIDRAQPEEISSYANQAASEIISSLHDYDANFKKSELRRKLKQLKLSHYNLTKSIQDYKMVKKYSLKAHHKFFKLLYLELMDYYDTIR